MLLCNFLQVMRKHQHLQLTHIGVITLSGKSPVDKEPLIHHRAIHWFYIHLGLEQEFRKENEVENNLKCRGRGVDASVCHSTNNHNKASRTLV